MASRIERLNPTTLPDTSALGYSQVSVAPSGRLAFVSGQVAIPADGSAPPVDFAEQARLAASNARKALDALGASAADIVLARVYVVNLNDQRMTALMPALQELFANQRPSLTGIGVAALASPELQIEIELTVSVPA